MEGLLPLKRWENIALLSVRFRNISHTKIYQIIGMKESSLLLLRESCLGNFNDVIRLQYNTLFSRDRLDVSAWT
jgi:hypothetical protein